MRNALPSSRKIVKRPFYVRTVTARQNGLVWPGLYGPGGYTVNPSNKVLATSRAFKASVSRDAAFPLSYGRGDQVTHAGGDPDPREQPPKGFRTRDIYVADLHIDVLKTKSRNFH
jgi:hypothetical protein